MNPSRKSLEAQRDAMIEEHEGVSDLERNGTGASKFAKITH